MRFLYRFSLLASILFLCLAASCGGPTKIEIGGDCSAEGSVCVDGATCCAADKKCKKEADCKGGACKNPCKGKDDCFNNQECKDGCCAGKTGPSTCKKDLDCPKGQECSNGSCNACILTCESTTECIDQDVCENGCCRVPPCNQDKDCKSSTPVCDKESGRCVKCLKNEDCQGKQICKNKRCLDVECTSNIDCIDVNKPNCDQQSNKCVPKTVCKSNEDCAKLFPGGDRNRCDRSANGGLGECKKGSCATCTTDNECGGSGDFCVGTDKGLKDGSRCMIACNDKSDCPSGFVCSNAVISGFKICFPLNSYCKDPCEGKNCGPDARCVEGKCITNPKPCDSCKTDKDCGSGNKCITYQGGTFCGKACSSTADCPNSTDFTCLNSQCTSLNDCKSK